MHFGPPPRNMSSRRTICPKVSIFNKNHDDLLLFIFNTTWHFGGCVGAFCFVGYFSFI
jgi:hypothetical protein